MRFASHLYALSAMVVAVVFYLVAHDLTGFSLRDIEDIALFVALYMGYSALRRTYKIEEEVENVRKEGER